MPLLRGGNYGRNREPGGRIDTMMETIDFVGACFPNGTVGKFPRLEELYYKLFQSTFPAHNSMEDVRALRRCYYELKKRKII